MKPRVLIVDAQQIIGEGLERLIAQDDRFGTAICTPEAVSATVLMFTPQIVIINLHQSSVVAELQACRAIAEASHDVMVLLLAPGCVRADPRLVAASFGAGAVGLLDRDVLDSAGLIAALDTLLKGDELWNAREVRRALRQRAIDTAKADVVAQAIAEFTLRERDVFKLLVDGASNAAMAERLGLSERTIQSHVSSIFSKLGVCSRHQAVAAYYKWRLVPVDVLSKDE